MPQPKGYPIDNFIHCQRPCSQATVLYVGADNCCPHPPAPEPDPTTFFRALLSQPKPIEPDLR